MDETFDIPSDWMHAAKECLNKGHRTVLVIGATDRGKSSFCRFLTTSLLEAGHSVAFIDADLGQKDLGPPATITLGYPQLGVDLSASRLAELHFVGSLSPAGHFLSMMVGSRKLSDAAVADTVVIDTPGLITGPGRSLLSFQIESIRPELIVALEQNGELESLLHSHRHLHIIRLNPSPLVRTKSARRRYTLRTAAFQHYFSTSSQVELDLDRLIVQRTRLFNGKQIELSGAHYAEQDSEGVIAVAKRTTVFAERKLLRLPLGFEHNLLCGLGDRKGRSLGLGRIVEIDYSRRRLLCLTPVHAHLVESIEFGALYVREQGHHEHVEFRGL